MDTPNILTSEQIEDGLKNLPDWKFEDDKLSKEFKFNDFMDSLNFINKMAPIFEANDHHPDTHIMYSKILFELQRFDVGGKVTDRDLFIAGEIEKAYQSR
ncbi:4a-hydroxytetrahydrobiopterin dehydratase [Candidatus Parcubacteria bacterium]|nr:4a-hydroxytetrahydrobiopterin dehydratase [Candidatus Parcubacteria bacterium]